MFEDRIFRIPRRWSNEEISRIAHEFSGEVLNVSGWRDEDKQGRRYRDYFHNASSYHVSNYISDARGFQGDIDNEYFLDLIVPLPDELYGAYDLVFSHTVLEHVFEVGNALDNLCSLTRDSVMIVVPFLQEQHADYGDYWRFTPLCIRRLFWERGLSLMYLSYNEIPKTSVYVFAIASKHPDKWAHLRAMAGNRLDDIDSKFIGRNAIPRGPFHSIRCNAKRFWRKR